jgi:hypothetical protein
MKSGIIIDPNVLVEVHDASSGKLLRSEQKKNRVVAAGRDVVRDLLCGVDYPPGHIAFGSGSTAAADTDVQLELEFFRNAFTRIIPSQSKVTYQLYMLPTQANGYTIREIGLFRGPKLYYSTDAAGLGVYGARTLVARAVITDIAKDSNVTVTISWELPIQSAT